VFGEPLEVSADASEQLLEQKRVDLEHALMALGPKALALLNQG
jgi:hypothetical protein